MSAIPAKYFYGCFWLFIVYLGHRLNKAKTMTKTTKQAISVEDFMQARKPDHSFILDRLSADMVTLHVSGYSLKSIHEYVTANGYKGGYAAMTKWVRYHLDLAPYKKKPAA